MGTITYVIVEIYQVRKHFRSHLRYTQNHVVYNAVETIIKLVRAAVHTHCELRRFLHL